MQMRLIEQLRVSLEASETEIQEEILIYFGQKQRIRLEFNTNDRVQNQSNISL